MIGLTKEVLSTTIPAIQDWTAPLPNLSSTDIQTVLDTNRERHGFRVYFHAVELIGTICSRRERLRLQLVRRRVGRMHGGSSIV